MHIVYYIGGPWDLTKRIMEGDSPKYGHVVVAEAQHMTLAEAEAKGAFNVIQHLYHLHATRGRTHDGKGIYLAIHDSM